MAKVVDWATSELRNISVATYKALVAEGWNPTNAELIDSKFPDTGLADDGFESAEPM